MGATASTSYASWDSCSFTADYGTWMVSYMQGFQADPTSTDTDCYASVEQFTKKLDIIGSSVNNFSFDDWAAPVYALSDSSVAFLKNYTGRPSPLYDALMEVEST